MGYNPPPVTPAGTPVVAPQSRQVAGSTPVIEQQTVAAPPAASTAPSSGIPVVPAVAALAGIGVIGGGGLLPALVDPTAEPGTVPEIRLIRYPERPGNDLIVFFRLHFIIRIRKEW